MNCVMCVRPISLKKLTGFDSAIVPCGKCPECLANRANDLSVRVVREALHLGNFFLVTFTYDNEHIPIFLSDYVVNTDTGEETFVSLKRASVDIRKQFFDNANFTWHVNKNGKPCKRYEPYLLYSSSEGDLLRTRYAYFSVDNSDFQKFMKSSRIYYERHYGSLPKFKYLAVPEYGGVSYRPHIHCLFFGLPEEIIDFFVSRWQYGTANDKKKVKYNFSDFTKVSHYVSQYACKGSFDCPYIFSSNCLRPRRCFSREFGVGDKEELLSRFSYWKCEDIYGSYDITDLSKFSDSEKFNLVDSVLSRRYYDLNGYKYPIPQYLKRLCFYNTVLHPFASVLNECLTDKSLSYEQRQKIFKQFSRKCSIGRDGKVRVQRIYPNSTKKVASELQSLVTAAVFEHIHRNMSRSLEGEYEGIIFPSSTNSFDDYCKKSSLLVHSQKTKEKASELCLLNKIYNSVY